jgi:hypothetical protein
MQVSHNGTMPVSLFHLAIGTAAIDNALNLREYRDRL